MIFRILPDRLINVAIHYETTNVSSKLYKLKQCKYLPLFRTKMWFPDLGKVPPISSHAHFRLSIISVNII